MLSLLIPIYNEEEVLRISYERLKKEMDRSGFPYEMVFINDGSEDASLQILREIVEKDASAKAIHFSKNFGHEIAITAGLDHARGDAIIIIDADLQDPPELIHEMISLWKKGYDVVYGRRKKRKGETFFKKLTASLFYHVMNFMSEMPFPKEVGHFRLMDRKVRDSLLLLRERNRFMRGLITWVGFKQTSLEFVREPRTKGESKYGLMHQIRLAASAIISFSIKPLRIATYVGLATSLLGFLFTLIVLYEKFFTDQTVQGWTSLMCVTLVFNGIILMVLGIIGEYIGFIFTEVKKRPLYIVDAYDGDFQTGRETRIPVEVSSGSLLD